jgi:CTP synthase
MTKFIFITGGVVSSLGKGITAASIGRLLVNRGLRVGMAKFDPYLNVDPGTMSPYQHGEVFVTDDGAETDLDLGHYERFIGQDMTRVSNVTAGQVYWSVLSKERKGEFLGGTIQVIPHITDEIKAMIRRVSEKLDPQVMIVEIGGTVGDIESLPFLEAIRQFRAEVGREHVMNIHVTLLPYLAAAREMKTKPTQHSVKELRSVGIQPDVIVCRTEHPMDDDLRNKISLFCDIERHAVVENRDEEIVYAVPRQLAEQHLDMIVLARLGIKSKRPDWREWDQVLQRMINPQQEVDIAVVGKYAALKDAYLSVVEAIRHGGIANKTRVNIRWVQAEDLEKVPPEQMLGNVDGILVPGGFGYRGIEGKIIAARYARENRIPYLGLCLGMQIAVVEFARNVCGLTGANSTEFVEDTPAPVIHLLPGQRQITDKGGTMRLGLYPCHLAENSRAHTLYGTSLIHERHRHRFELNNDYRELLIEKGLLCSGVYQDENLVEIIELPDHPWFVAVQFHPEFKSKPTDPHPLFAGFIFGAAEYRKNR